MVSLKFWIRERRKGSSFGHSFDQQGDEDRRPDSVLDEHASRTKSFERENSPPPDFVEDAFPKESVEEDDSAVEKRISLFSVENMVNLLQEGTDTQRTVILGGLGPAYEYCREETLTVIVPLLCRLVDGWGTDLKALAAEALVPAFEDGPQISPETAKTVTVTALRVIELSKEEIIWQAWGDVLAGSLSRVHREDQDLEQIFRIVDTHAGGGSDASRKLSARLLVLLSYCLEPSDLGTWVLERTLRLSEDDNYYVRGMAAEALEIVCSALPLEVTETRVWQRLACLVKDRDSRIQAAALRAVAAISEQFRSSDNDRPFYSTLLPPLLNYQCVLARSRAYDGTSKLNPATMKHLETFAEVLGQLIVGTQRHWVGEMPRSVYMTFLALSMCDNVLVKRKAAHNLPACALCLRENYAPDIVKVLQILISSHDADTRWYVAAGFHETTKLLVRAETAEALYGSFLALLEDPNEVVRDKVLEQFHVTLGAILDVTGSEDRFGSLYKNIQLLGRDGWRTQRSLAFNLEKSAHLFGQGALRAIIVPLLLILVEQGTCEVRKAAVSATITCLRCVPDMNVRDELLETLRELWARNRVHWLRVAFLDASYAALHTFSTITFRNLFARDVMDMVYDPCCNVRLRVASLIHLLAPSCSRMPEFEQSVKALQGDPDIDVAERMEGVRTRIIAAMDEALRNAQEDRKRQEYEAETYQRFLMSRVSVRKGNNRDSPPTNFVKAAGLKVFSALGNTFGHEDFVRHGTSVYIPVDRECLRSEFRSSMDQEHFGSRSFMIDDETRSSSRSDYQQRRSFKLAIEEFSGNLRPKSVSERRVSLGNRGRTSERRSSIQWRMSSERNRRISVDTPSWSSVREKRGRRDQPMNIRSRFRNNADHASLKKVGVSPGLNDLVTQGKALDRSTSERGSVASGTASDVDERDFGNLPLLYSQDGNEHFSQSFVSVEDSSRSSKMNRGQSAPLRRGSNPRRKPSDGSRYYVSMARSEGFSIETSDDKRSDDRVRSRSYALRTGRGDR